MQFLVVRISPRIIDNIARVSKSQYESFEFSLNDRAILELLFPSQNQFVALQPETKLDENHALFLGSDLAHCLGLKENDEVMCKKVNNVQNAKIIFATPETADDYEIILTNQKLVENTVLNQNLVAYKGMQLVVHITEMVAIKLVINRANEDPSEPISCYQMVDGTELVIETKTRNNEQVERRPRCAIFSNLTLANPDSVATIFTSFLHSESIDTEKYLFIDTKIASEYEWSDGDTISVAPLLDISYTCVELFPKENQNPIHQTTGVQYSKFVERITTRLTVAMIPKEKTLPSGTCICLAFEPGCPLYFSPQTSFSTDGKLAECVFPWKDLLHFPTKEKVEICTGMPLVELFDFNSLWTDETKKYQINQNCIISGSRGSGKTTTLKYIQRVTSSILVDGIEIGVLRPNERITKLKSAFMACALSGAALLIDNFDRIFYHSEKHTNLDEDENIVHAALVLCSLCKLQENAGNFSIVASRQTCTSILPTVLQQKVQYIFPKQLNILELPSESAVQLLFNWVPALSDISSDIHSYAISYLSNFTPGDVISLASVILRLMSRRRESTFDTFHSACATFCPLVRENLPMLKNFDEKTCTDIEDVVTGMELAKKKFHSLILLPMQNPSKFSVLPIKLSRGILLCGPSGCGKTYFVRKFIESHGLRCISVNGPEMFQKYIGSSEAKVREIFEQAQQIAPSVLFIDEIDACVPKRGSDHNGISDRIVNQFLCEMDGVEDREGVYFICTSSRPEIIDKALLRPGRIDTILHCTLPTLKERHEALVHFQKRVEYPFERPIDVDDYARRMENWSYADIHLAFDRSLDETMADLLSSHISTDEEKAMDHNVEHQIVLVRPGNLSVTEAKNHVEHFRKLFISKEEPMPVPRITLKCFDNVVKSMQSSVNMDDTHRISDFISKKNSSVIPGQRIAVI